MKTIWKFPIEMHTKQEVQMPQCADILTAQVQGSQLCLWALVQPENKIEKRTILIFGTGHPVDNVGRYIATFQMEGGGLIFHVFEQRS